MAIIGILFSPQCRLQLIKDPPRAPFAGYQSTSMNWSGYAEASSGSNGAIVGVAGSVADVKGSWTVPTSTGPKSGVFYHFFSLGRY